MGLEEQHFQELMQFCKIASTGKAVQGCLQFDIKQQLKGKEKPVRAGNNGVWCNYFLSKAAENESTPYTYVCELCAIAYTRTLRI